MISKSMIRLTTSALVIGANMLLGSASGVAQSTTSPSEGQTPWC